MARHLQLSTIILVKVQEYDRCDGKRKVVACTERVRNRQLNGAVDEGARNVEYVKAGGDVLCLLSGHKDMVWLVAETRAQTHMITCGLILD